MTAEDVLEIIDWLEQQGVEVWLNGGWGVDALLGRQTREHQDLDLTISAKDRGAYSLAMQALGFGTYRTDNDFNWVVIDSKGRLVDVHLVDFGKTVMNTAGENTYGPAGLPFEVGSLDGRGTIAGITVKCETAEFQVRGHTRYPPDATDYEDVLALCRAFGIEIPGLFKDLGLHQA
ncbi:MAG TPA: hypothetical protein VIN00_04680 [Candidatus Dormibacteraeota bacterium]|jgi:lincosamide nucleotidyltransferase A/C/D/E